MFNDDHTVAGIHQLVEGIEQALDVGQVEASGWLVQDIQGTAATLVLPSSWASLIRWASPPEIVVEDWPSLR